MPIPTVRCRSCGKIPCKYHKIARRGHARSHHKVDPNMVEQEIQKRILEFDLRDPKSKLYQSGIRAAITI